MHDEPLYRSLFRRTAISPSVFSEAPHIGSVEAKSCPLVYIMAAFPVDCPLSEVCHKIKYQPYRHIDGVTKLPRWRSSVLEYWSPLQYPLICACLHAHARVEFVSHTGGSHTAYCTGRTKSRRRCVCHPVSIVGRHRRQFSLDQYSIHRIRGRGSDYCNSDSATLTLPSRLSIAEEQFVGGWTRTGPCWLFSGKSGSGDWEAQCAQDSSVNSDLGSVGVAWASGITEEWR